MNYHHLRIEERSCIRKYYVDSLSYREIARLVGRNVSTISREIRRNCTHMYDIPTYYYYDYAKIGQALSGLWDTACYKIRTIQKAVKRKDTNPHLASHLCVGFP